MKKIRSLLAITLFFALIISAFFVFVPGGQTAEAATSLPGIEAVKQSAGVFNILEIIPDSGSAGIGWYISGQEPGANWVQDKLAALSESDRTDAADAYLASLENAGLLGVSGTPLYKTRDYKEYLPWEDRSGVPDLKPLILSSAETYSVTGTFSEAAAGGEYRADNTYNVSAGGSGGDYDQDIFGLTLLSGPQTGGTHYYCTLGSFAPLAAFDDVPAGQLIFRVVDSAESPYDITIDAETLAFVPAAEAEGRDPATLIYLTFHGCMGSSYLTGLNLLAEYYIVPFIVSETYSSAAPQFEAEAEGFIRVGSGQGHFDAVTTSYTYVGLGAADGDYSYSPSGTNTYTVKTRTLFYTGGFTNNDWFLKYVFNWESGEPAPTITVRSVIASGVTESDVADADLIVLSEGFGNASAYSSGSDISAATAADIISAGEAKLPIIVDNSLRSKTGLRIGQLAASLTSGKSESHYVANNIYCINSALVTGAFNDAIAGNHKTNDSPFYPVWYEINYENFLRKQNDADAVLLPETVSIAACVRYIINYGGQRVVTNKTDIRVLELQPGSGQSLTKSKVNGWTGIPTGRITIDTMSTSEFIGKIDDLVETYDLIYIGSNLSGFSTSGGVTQYTDTDMNGLIYSNIGDTYVSGYNLTGLLNKDYSATIKNGVNAIEYESTTKTFRFSGNDITGSKVSELLDFARAGYPVVVADNLMSGTPGQDAFSFTAVVTESDGALIAAARDASGTTIPYGVTKTYQWYRKGPEGDTLVSSSGASYKPSETGTYYCAITINGQTATSNSAEVTVRQRPYTVTAASPSRAIAARWRGDNGGKSYEITVVQNYNSSYRTYTYDVSVSPNDYDSISYQWYGKGYYGSEYLLTGETSSRFVDTYNYYYYMCKVTLNGCALDSDTIYWNDPGTYNVTRKIFNASVSASVSSSGVTLTGSFNPEVGSANNRSIRWYSANDPSIFDRSTITVTEPGTYYCRARVRYNNRDYDAFSNYYTVAGGGMEITATVNTDYGPAAHVPAINPQLTVNPATVDYCSQLYSFLNTITGYTNTFTESGADINSATLTQYLNLSKPKIVFSAHTNGTPMYPTEYTGPTGPSLSVKALSFTFTIENETDVTPAETRYYCNLYIDMNADGRYGYAEQLADILITDGNGNVVRTGELRAGVTYTVTRTMPDEYVGIIPWQLEVVKTTQSRVHASEHNYTHISGTAKTIYILQILDDGGGLNLTTNNTYRDLFDLVSDFDLNISTRKAGTLSQISSGNVTRKDENGVNQTVHYSNLNEYLNTFDMLILGFEDCYGELDRAAANAVVDFINNPSGKAVLFTHDTTSFANLPAVTSSGYPTTSSSYIPNNWGYYFNTILRDAVGLDRYGVTNPYYGITSYSPNKNTANRDGINVAAGPLALGDTDDLIAAGYSIAYKPASRGSVSSSTVKATIPEVQGFSRYTLRRYSGIDSSSGLTTTQRVSQVNEGQITTYPFDLNLAGFGNTQNTASTMQIATTHEQYYQLNMNSDDIVVWYCLSGGKYDNLPNDVINDYYIYSVGNVTYSGAGHSGDSVTLDEARLFINTMIAAYQTATTPPTIQIIDPKSGEELTDKFYVGDDMSILADSPDSLADSAIYFTVIDPSLGSGKVITASFSYRKNGVPTAITLPIYVKGGAAIPINLDKNENSIAYTLSGGATYYIDPTSELLDILQENNRVALTITITSNLLPSQPAHADITLHKLGLFLLD